MKSGKRILVAPLNWGLGHATRCIPLINALIENNFLPILASDGQALELLKKEFPTLTALELPSYGISYPRTSSLLKLKLLKDSPKIIRAIKRESHLTEKIVEEQDISGIISDNRYGVKHKNIPSAFITHQVNVLSGSTSWLSSKLQQKLISGFDECWVPDSEKEPNLSGKLGHNPNSRIELKYFGPISRFVKKPMDIKYDLLVLLSGPEPQRTLLETQLLKKLKRFDGDVLFVKGIVENEQHYTVDGNMTIYNFMKTSELETALNQSELVLSRSGYTTIMDLAKLEKKAFFIPTPGQYEQEYLARTLSDKDIAPFSNQYEFELNKLGRMTGYKGFSNSNEETDYESLFSLFKGK